MLAYQPGIRTSLARKRLILSTAEKAVLALPSLALWLTAREPVGSNGRLALRDRVNGIVFESQGGAQFTTMTEGSTTVPAVSFRPRGTNDSSTRLIGNFQMSESYSVYMYMRPDNLDSNATYVCHDDLTDDSVGDDFWFYVTSSGALTVRHNDGSTVSTSGMTLSSNNVCMASHNRATTETGLYRNNYNNSVSLSTAIDQPLSVDRVMAIGGRSGNAGRGSVAEVLIFNTAHHLDNSSRSTVMTWLQEYTGKDIANI